MEGDASPSSTFNGNPLPDFKKKTLIIKMIVSVFLFFTPVSSPDYGTTGCNQVAECRKMLIVLKVSTTIFLQRDVCKGGRWVMWRSSKSET